ncbi:MAG: hypothetical protein M3069_20690 [Chloroflexota bacterium]|nr:hypothetical protein [Chloroflexota bacterium]
MLIVLVVMPAAYLLAARLLIGAASLVFFYGLWFGLTLSVRFRINTRAVR